MTAHDMKDLHSTCLLVMETVCWESKVGPVKDIMNKFKVTSLMGFAYHLIF